MHLWKGQRSAPWVNLGGPPAGAAKRGLTQAGVAQVAGAGNRFVSELERGKATAEFGKVLWVVSVLGLDLHVVCRPGAIP